MLGGEQAGEEAMLATSGTQPSPAAGTAAQLVLGRFRGLPSMSAAHAARMEAFLREHRPRDCLELGFQHGKSSAVIAATLRDLGCGHLTTVDREDARAHRPNIEAVLGELGLRAWVTVHYEPRSYTWRLMKLIEAHPEPAFDFCYIDGGHSWDVTGYAFCLVDRLLRPGGWVLFDDLDWTFERMAAPDRELPGFLRQMPEEERATPQVRRVWDLLVRRHQDFDVLAEDEQWGLAQKARPAAASSCEGQVTGRALDSRAPRG
jgi:predicted O-methyltransferase YrrM